MLKLHVRTFNPIQEPLLPGLDKSLSQRRSLQVNLILITSLKKKKKRRSPHIYKHEFACRSFDFFLFLTNRGRRSWPTSRVTGDGGNKELRGPELEATCRERP